MLGIEVLFSDAQDIVFGDFFDGFGILREVIQAEIIELHLSEDVRQLRAGVDAQWKAADDKRLGFAKFLIRDRCIANPLYFGQTLR